MLNIEMTVMIMILMRDDEYKRSNNTTQAITNSKNSRDNIWKK